MSIKIYAASVVNSSTFTWSSPGQVLHTNRKMIYTWKNVKEKLLVGTWFLEKRNNKLNAKMKFLITANNIFLSYYTIRIFDTILKLTSLNQTS